MLTVKQRVFYILVPVYNVEKYVGDCIESVLKQTYVNWELILVDDGSTDFSGTICDGYAAIDKKIKVIHKKNGGSLSARQAARYFLLNRDFDKSGYVIYLDSDYLLELNALQIINDIIDLTNCDLVIYRYKRFWNERELRCNGNKCINYEIIEDKRILYKRVFTNDGYNSLCRKAKSVNLVEKNDYSEYFKIAHGEDLLQSLFLYQKSKCVAFTDVELYRYRENPNSITHSVSYDNYRVVSTVRREVWLFLQRENVWTENDYLIYRQYNKKLLKDEVRLIAGFKINKHSKYKLFDDILDDNYYKMVLDWVENKDYILKKLRKRKYIYVLFACCCYRYVSALKRFFKRRRVKKS